MRRKTTVALGVAALLIALLLGQVGSGQMGPMGQPQAQAQMSPEQLQHEIQLLMAINRMGLTVEQLGELKNIIAELKTIRHEPMVQQRGLREFLLSWQGSPEEFEGALRAFQEQAEQARQQLRQRHRDAIEQLKETLSYRQGELLMGALKRLDGPGAMGHMAERMAQHTAQMQQMHQSMGRMGRGMRPQMGMMGQRQMRQPMGQMGGMMGMMGPMGPMGQAPRQTFGELILKHLDLLERVIDEKLQALRR
jgi:hypothetical protein